MHRIRCIGWIRGGGFADRHKDIILYLNNNQVTASEEYDYTYDGFGRMAQRRVRDSAVCQHYHYDAEHRITAVTFEHDPQGNQRAEYEYDILGRRTGKRVWQSAQAQRLKQPPENRAPEETVQFCWNGLRLAAEKSSKSAHLTLHYVYNSGSYNPLARIESFDHPEKQTTDISYYHIALNGLPEELTDSQGRIIWHGDYSLWGKLKREQHPAPGFRGQQNLRFQGQYFDRETGLHYNTFRYYAPDTGRFTQQDPIGLLGGLNLYQYAPNPLTWVDPWGWSNKPLNSPDIINWTNKGGTVYQEINSKVWVYVDWEGNKVRYPNGYPDFSPYVVQSVDVTDLKGNHSKSPSGDFGKADKLASSPANYDVNTWHHHENTVTMQEVPKKINSRFTHRGGASIIKKGC